jgi:hypothetical protein
MNQGRDMNADYKSRKGTDKRTSRVLWLCLWLWGLVACAAPPQTGQFAFVEAEFGAVVTSGAVGASNSPTEVRSEFTRDDGMIYAVFEVKRIEPGTQLYVRWKSEPLEFEEQSSALTADRAYENIYLEFHLEPVQGNTLSALEAGEYEVQLFVNEKAGPKATFRVSGE